MKEIKISAATKNNMRLAINDIRNNQGKGRNCGEEEEEVWRILEWECYRKDEDQVKSEANRA